MRLDIINSIAEYRREQRQALIGDFSSSTFQPNDTFFLRIGGGSLGGKARGLAFVRHLFRERQIASRFPGVNIAVPSTLVLATDVYDQFLAENNLLEFAIRSSDEAEIEQRFLAAILPAHVRESLLAFLADLHYPLAVRSSSLLEDSQYQPFTGVYETFMLSNRQPDLPARFNQLNEAIKRVYASTFSEHAKALRARHALPAGRGKDGGHHPAGGGRGSRKAFLSGLFGSGSIAEFLPCRSHDRRRWSRGCGLGAGPRSRRGWKEPRLLSSIPSEPDSVFLRSKISWQTREPSSGPWSRIIWRDSLQQGIRFARGAIRARRGGGRWNAAQAGLHVFARQSCHL